VTIDGSNSGWTDKSITFANSSTAANTYAIGLLNNGTQGASNCVIRNCNLKASSQLTNNTYGIFLSTTGGGYNNIVIENNSIFSARYGIQFAGTSSSKASNGQILNNLIGTPTTTSEIKYCGIYVTQAENTLIQGNEIMGPAAGNSNTQQSGIWLFTGATNTKIHKNKIHDFYYNGTAGNGAFGIYFNTSSAATVTEISNNLIYNLKADGNTSSSSNQFKTPAGIQVNNGGNAKIYFNTISLTGSYLSSTIASISSCISICNGASGTFDIRNNILRNSMQPVSGAGNSTYGIYSAKPTSSFSNLDYNDYFVNGINPNIGFMTANQATLPAWQTATGKETNGQNADPLFVSATDLHPQQSLLIAGTPIAPFTTDFSGITRAVTPTIGAYELPQVTTSAASDITATGATLNGTVNGCSQTVVSSFEYGTTTAYGSTIAASPSPVSGITTTPVTASVTGLGSGTLIHYRAVGTVGTANYYGADMTFTTPYDPLEVTATVTDVTGCFGINNGAIQTTVTGGVSPYAYAWSNGATTASLADLGAGTYTVTVTDAVSTSVTGSWNVIQTTPVCDSISVSGTVTTTVCYNATNTITVAGGAAPFIVEAPNGHATFIAGQRIFFLPGTTVDSGAYMLAYISDSYCTNPTMPLVALESGKAEPQTQMSSGGMKIYPNPTTGSFTLEFPETDLPENLSAFICDIRGKKILDINLNGQRKQVISLENQPKGMYFIRLFSNEKSETAKILKQ
jgi:hypothetical protein